MGIVTYKLEGMQISKTSTVVLGEIIKNITQSINPVVKHRFPDSSKNFEMFIGNDLSNEAMDFSLVASDLVVFEESVNIITEAFTSKSPAILPKDAYNAMKALVERARKQEGSLAVYNSDPKKPLFEFTQGDVFPEYPESTGFIEEELKRIGMIYSIYYGAGKPIVRIRLLNGQRFQTRVDRDTGILLGKYIFQWMDVFGRAKRKVGSAKFEDFEIIEVAENPQGKEIARNYYKNRGFYLPLDTLEGEEAIQFIRSLR